MVLVTQGCMSGWFVLKIDNRLFGGVPVAENPLASLWVEAILSIIESS